MQVLREKGQINMYSIFYADLDLKPPQGDMNLICSDGNVITARFFQNLIANRVFGQVGIRGPAGLFIQIILKLVVLEIRRQHLKANIYKSDKNEKAQDWFEIFHMQYACSYATEDWPCAHRKSIFSAGSSTPRYRRKFIRDAADSSIMRLACRAVKHFNFTFGNLFANSDPKRDAY